MMMPRVSVDLPGEAAGRSYEVIIGPGVRAELGDVLAQVGARRAVVVADARVAALHLDETLAQCSIPVTPLTFPPGEHSKSLATAEQLYDGLAAAGMTRGDVLLTLGGGVAGDLGGFVAATWMRGIRYVQIPTTLEAAIDASIGGKTAVNHASGKNRIGAFHQPIAVIVDTDCLGTLPLRDMRGGLAESVKHALIRDAAFFDWQERHVEGVLGAERPSHTLVELIARNCRIKASVVAADEREAGTRMDLNFGHTIGHAIEHLVGYRLRHGECVGLGMLAACEVSRGRGLIDAGVVARVRGLLEKIGLPVRLAEPLDVPRVVAETQRDKKRIGDALHFVLLAGIGRVMRVTDVRDEEIEAGLEVIRAE